MPARRYEITTDAAHTRATVNIWEDTGPSASSKAIARQSVRTNATQATLNGITSLILSDYLNTITPANGATLPPVTREQQNAVARLIARRLLGTQEATISSTEIATRLLLPFVATPPDQWTHRYSVERSSGEGTWTVAKAANGTWGCSCPQWKFKRRQCKHIDAVLQHPNWYPYVQE